ncbi:MAG: alpha-L-fucosidase [bacterium]
MNSKDANGEQDTSAQQVFTRQANTPERVEWYQDKALGMYIFWTVDAQLGIVEAHSVIGASDDYLHRYFNDLPRTFNPRHFDAAWYARMAKVCGFDYVCICAKNHNGWCAWDTQTTEFNVMRTPFGRDLMRELTDAFHAQGIPVSLYFSPDDAWFSWVKHGLRPSRLRDYDRPDRNPALLEYDKAQIRELIEKYEPEMLCFDGGAGAEKLLVEFAWSLRPDIMITRGALTTPEQSLPDTIRGPFEAHYTIGTQWQYKAGNDTNKTGKELIELLFRIRALGGTLLLAIGGPDDDGLLPRDKDDLLRELGLWLFVNGEAVRGVRPWSVVGENTVMYSAGKDGSTLYVLDTQRALGRGERRTLTIASARATPETRIEVLGHSGELLEYDEKFDARPKYQQTDFGLVISYTQSQRMYNNWQWPNPAVVKLTNVEPAQ